MTSRRLLGGRRRRGRRRRRDRRRVDAVVAVGAPIRPAAAHRSLRNAGAARGVEAAKAWTPGHRHHRHQRRDGNHRLPDAVRDSPARRRGRCHALDGRGFPGRRAEHGAGVPEGSRRRGRAPCARRHGGLPLCQEAVHLVADPRLGRPVGGKPAVRRHRLHQRPAARPRPGGWTCNARIPRPTPPA